MSPEPFTIAFNHVNPTRIKRGYRAHFFSLLAVLTLWHAPGLVRSHAAGTERLELRRYNGGAEIAENLRYAFDAGDSYRTPQGVRTLKRIAGLLAVAPKPGVSAQALISDGALPGYTVQGELTSGISLLAAPLAQRREQLRTRSTLKPAPTSLRQHAVSANPVFMDPDTGRQLILAQSVIVQLKPHVDPAAYFQPHEAVRPLRGSTDQFIISMPAASAEEIFQEVNRRFDDAAVEWAEPDTIGQMIKLLTPNDPLYNQQWHFHNFGQGNGRADADIDAPAAWDLATGSPNVVIAVLDDGLEMSHPDIQGNIALNPGEALNGIDDDLNGYVDDLRGWDFINSDNDPSPVFISDRHGTACAGVAAAIANNGIGVAGAGYNCRILPIRMFGVAASTAAESIYYAAGRSRDGARRWRGADILSISLAIPRMTVIDTALSWAATNGRAGKGCLLFAASGNDASRWQTATLTGVPAGTHTYDWVFRKDALFSAGADTAWLDGVIFPDGTSESFEGTTLPPGWSSFGSALWFSVQDNVGGNHALTGWSGINARAVRAGDIGDSQISGLRVTRSSGLGTLIFSTWVSAEYDPFEYFDHLEFYLDNNLIFRIDDDPAIAPRTALEYPASHVDTIAVGASTDFDFRSDYSAYTGDLDFVTPSDGGFSAIWTIDRLGAAGYDPGDYTFDFGGTSAACPLAAGVAGLILSANTNLSSRNVRRLMQATCDKIGNVTYAASGTNQFYGYGRINAAAALANARPRVTSIQTNTTMVTIRFPSIVGWSYNLERANALTGPWTGIQTNIAGTGSVIQRTDTRVTTPAATRYYRLRVLP